MYLAGGTMHLFKPASEIPELQEGRLLQLVERCVSQYVLRQTANAHVHMLCLSVLSSRFWTPCQKAPSICCLTCGGRDTNCMHEQKPDYGAGMLQVAARGEERTETGS